MTKAKATGYSLWLVSERDSETYELLTQLIRNVAAQYQTPVFDPHVTLLGGVDGAEQDMCEKTRLLAKKLEPYEIQLGDIGSNGIYFQILFSKVIQTYSVIDANTTAQKVFGVAKGNYFPHFSIAYGDLSNKQVVALQQFVMQENKIAGMHFLVQAVELWHSAGTVQEWHRVAIFPFRKS